MHQEFDFLHHHHLFDLCSFCHQIQLNWWLQNEYSYYLMTNFFLFLFLCVFVVIKFLFEVKFVEYYSVYSNWNKWITDFYLHKNSNKKEEGTSLSHSQSWFVNCFFEKNCHHRSVLNNINDDNNGKKILRVCLLSVNFYFHLFFHSSFNSSSFVVFSFILFYHF